jgi:hypothetical protein
VTKKDCPLGEDCDLTLAWMKGAAAMDTIVDLRVALHIATEEECKK